jgi:hypothetical protein
MKYACFICLLTNGRRHDILYPVPSEYADMAELADALDSGRIPYVNTRFFDRQTRNLVVVTLPSHFFHLADALPYVLVLAF